MNNKLHSLQGIRALATIGIFLFHSGLLLRGTFPVTLFFMLSGFMMYYTKNGLKQYESFSDWIKKYFVKKVKQFYPLHLITFVLSLFVGEVFFKIITGETIISAILNVLLVHPFFETYSLTFNGLSWYLAVTFFLYFIGYFLVKLVDDECINTKGFIAVVLVIILGINLCNRCIGTLYVYCNPFYRILDFLLGMSIAKLFLKNTYQIKNTNKIEISIVFVFILQYLLSFIVGDDPGYYSILFTVALYVFAQGGGVVSKILSLNVFEIISKYSFEFYMFHELMLRIFRKVFVNLSFWYPIQCVVIAIPALVCTIFCVYLYTRLKTFFYKRM